MISKFRIKIDLIGQVVLIVGIFLLAIFKSGAAWTNSFLIVLAIWQVLSALHLLYAYKYVKKLSFLKTMFVLIVSLPVWIHLIGYFAYVPVAGILLWYFLQTASDMVSVNNRPKSFWDLE
jgi:uncharacterized membrane protein YfhO